MTSSNSSASSAEVAGEAHRLQGPDLRLLRHADRLGIGDDRGAQAPDEQASRKLTRDEILEAHARHESSQQVQTPAKLYRDLLATVYRRLAEEWGVAASWSDCAAYGRSIRNWPAFADTAAVASISEAAVQAGDPVERRQRELFLQQRKARGRFRRGLHRRGLRLLQALDAQFRLHARQAQDARDREERDPAHRREPVPRPRTGERAWPRLMLDSPPPRPGGLRRDRGARRRRPDTTFASRVWPTWSRRISRR